MRNLIGLTKRNLLVYFKDKGSIFFSMLTPLIVFILYCVFLKDNFVSAIDEASQGLNNMIHSEDLSQLANGILLTGILGSAFMTVSYNSLMTIVKDRENKIDYDVSVTPVGRVTIVFSYFLASTISAFIMSVVILVSGLFLVERQGSMYFQFQDYCKLFGITFLGSLSATAFFMVIVIFFKSSSASGAFMGLLSAVSGFVIGAYIPISQFSKSVRTVCNLFPATGVTVLLRNGIMGPLMDHINEDLGGIDEGVFVASMKEAFSFQTSMGDFFLSIRETLFYVMIIFVVCVLAIAVIYPKIYKRK